MVRGVLFDADGVLIDACELHYVALNRALNTMGWSISRQEHEDIYNGLPTHRKLQVLTQEKGFPVDWHQAVHDLKQQFTSEAIDECIGFDIGKRSLLRTLRSHGLRIAVCSNSMRKTLEKMLMAVDVSDLVDVALGNDDVKEPKPSPEVFLLAAKRLGMRMSQCIIVEDSPVGLKAANAARPHSIIQVKGPHEVNASMMRLFEPYLGLAREAA